MQGQCFSPVRDKPRFVLKPPGTAFGQVAPAEIEVKMLDLYKEITRVVENGESAVLATIIHSSGSAPRKAGAKMLIKKDGTFIGTVGGGTGEEKVREKAKEVMESGLPLTMHFDLSGKGRDAAMICGGQMDVFLEPILSAERLYLFGAGHISQTTAAIGKMLGFKVTVIDPRAQYNNEERFPSADTRIVEEYDKAFQQLDIGYNGYIIIYTTGHVFDETCLEFAVGTRAKYIGMIGSKKKVKEVKDRLLQKGIPREKLDAVYAPIGVPIGAETPEEISVSILAEVVKVRRQHRTSEKAAG
jgi:xanthine dehydrogenase accessory factor